MQLRLVAYVQQGTPSTAVAECQLSSARWGFQASIFNEVIVAHQVGIAMDLAGGAAWKGPSGRLGGDWTMQVRFPFRYYISIKLGTINVLVDPNVG